MWKKIELHKRDWVQEDESRKRSKPLIFDENVDPQDESAVKDSHEVMKGDSLLSGIKSGTVFEVISLNYPTHAWGLLRPGTLGIVQNKKQRIYITATSPLHAAKNQPVTSNPETLCFHISGQTDLVVTVDEEFRGKKHVVVSEKRSSNGSINFQVHPEALLGDKVLVKLSVGKRFIRHSNYVLSADFEGDKNFDLDSNWLLSPVKISTTVQNYTSPADLGSFFRVHLFVPRPLESETMEACRLLLDLATSRGLGEPSYPTTVHQDKIPTTVHEDNFSPATTQEELCSAEQTINPPTVTIETPQTVIFSTTVHNSARRSRSKNSVDSGYVFDLQGAGGMDGASALDFASPFGPLPSDVASRVESCGLLRKRGGIEAFSLAPENCNAILRTLANVASREVVKSRIFGNLKSKDFSLGFCEFIMLPRGKEIARHRDGGSDCDFCAVFAIKGESNVSVLDNTFCLSPGNMYIFQPQKHVHAVGFPNGDRFVVTLRFFLRS